MSIVSIKKRLATIIASTLENEGVGVKILTVSFNAEDTANKPQTSKQILVVHEGNRVETTGIRLKIHRFRVELTLKDLRTDDTIQNVVDVIENALIDSRFYNRPLESLESSNEGYTDGIWKYVINLEISQQIGNGIDPDADCHLEDREITDITLNLHPSYSQPLS